MFSLIYRLKGSTDIVLMPLLLTLNNFNKRINIGINLVFLPVTLNVEKATSGWSPNFTSNIKQT